jgi:hypothetical protein
MRIFKGISFAEEGRNDKSSGFWPSVASNARDDGYEASRLRLGVQDVSDTGVGRAW